MDYETIYLFTGKSEIFIRNRIARIIQSLEKKKTTIIKYDMTDTPLDVVINDCMTVPFLEDLKLIILNNPIFLKQAKETIPPAGKRFIQYLKNPSDTTILLINSCGIEIPLSNEYYKVLRNVSEIIDYPEAEEIELKGWIIRRLASEQIEIREDALTVFLDYLNGDQARMDNELEKIISFAKHDGIITKETIRLLVPEDVTNAVFKLIEALISKNFEKVESIYQQIFANTKDISGMIALVTNKFKELFTTSSLLKEGYSQSDIAKFYQISTARAYYLVKDAKTFDNEALKKYITKIADFDIQQKNGMIDKKVGFELFLLSLKTI